MLWEHRSSDKQNHYMMEIVMSIYESIDIQKVFEIPPRDKEALMTENETTPVLNTNRYVHRNPFADQAN